MSYYNTFKTHCNGQVKLDTQLSNLS